jgi:predicted alpha/beta-hydrolase family hydrolase
LKPSNETVAPLGTGAVTALVYPAQRSTAALILAHGAGAGQRSPFIVAFARAIAALGVDVITFDFPYITRKRRVPDRGPVLEACFHAVAAQVRQDVESARRFLFIGGKSMGGRIATQIAAADPGLPVVGLILIGYPLHPPGRPAELRSAHLPAVRRPMLFVQGTRDAFGTPTELLPILEGLSPAASLHAVAGGDHSLKLAGRDPQAQAAVYNDVQQTIAVWIASVIT